MPANEAASGKWLEKIVKKKIRKKKKRFSPIG